MKFRNKQTNALYMQIADNILERILSGSLNPGDKMDSVRETAANTQVNPNTVQRSFTHLQDSGIIYNQRGIGYFISDDAYDKTREIKKDAFVNLRLPEIFKTMDLLKIGFEDLEKLYQKLNPKSNEN